MSEDTVKALPRALTDKLISASTGTLSTVLLKRGLRNVWLRGPRPIRTGQARIAGPAFTLRFVAAREDLATPASWASPISTRAAIEAMPPDCIAVADAMGVLDAGIFGDILCARMVKRSVGALITDGVVRDQAGVLGTGLPIWCAGAAAPPSVAGLTFVGWQEPIACGGVAIFPSDVIVADDDGALVVPAAMVEEGGEGAVDQEAVVQWSMKEGGAGARVPGRYTPKEEKQGGDEGGRDTHKPGEKKG